MNFYPRFAGASLPTPHAILFCEADRTVCTNVAAWSFAIAGQAVPPTLACFWCVDDLGQRAAAAGMSVDVVRVQGDLCQGCGRYLAPAKGGPGRLWVREVGPFCCDKCVVAAGPPAAPPAGGAS